MTVLRIDWCDAKAAGYAVRHWHYSHNMPRSKRNYLGVWEDGRFIGAVVFGLGGGNATNGARFGLRRNFDVAELMRVALREHATPVSRIVAIALRMLHKQSPGIRLVISYADPEQGHVGGIYQAMNWAYLGETAGATIFEDEFGRRVHNRVHSVSGFKMQYGQMTRTPAARTHRAMSSVQLPPKHIYVYALDASFWPMLRERAKPYPRREHEGNAPAFQAGEGGPTPTATLQS